MSAFETERWALHLALGLSKAGLDIPEDVASMGVAGIIELGINSIGKLDVEIAESLLQKMMTCVQIMPDPSKKNVVRDLIEQDIEEVTTLLEIRKAVVSLHTGFFTDAAQ